MQTAEELADGVVLVTTASHGGVWLAPERLAQMPDGERAADGWYEEDCEMAYVLRRFRDEIAGDGVIDPAGIDRYVESVMRRSCGTFARIAVRQPDARSGRGR